MVAIPNSIYISSRSGSTRDPSSMDKYMNTGERNERRKAYFSITSMSYKQGVIKCNDLGKWCEWDFIPTSSTGPPALYRRALSLCSSGCVVHMYTAQQCRWAGRQEARPVRRCWLVSRDEMDHVVQWLFSRRLINEQERTWWPYMVAIAIMLPDWSRRRDLFIEALNRVVMFNYWQYTQYMGMGKIYLIYFIFSCDW